MKYEIAPDPGGVKPSTLLRANSNVVRAIMAVPKKATFAGMQRKPITDLKRWMGDCRALVDYAVQRLQSGM